MAKVTRGKGPAGPSSATPQQPTGPVQATPSAKAPVQEDSFSQAAQGLLNYKSSPLVSGAMKIFGDNVVLPSNLTDPNNPRNDAKYLRLLSAVLGLDELERYFQTLEGKEQEDYLAHKAEQRERHLEKKAREREEREQGGEEETTHS